MTCHFEESPCVMLGAYICRKCKTCGHTLTAPAEMSESNITAAIETIKLNCKNNTEAQNTQPASSDNAAAPVNAELVKNKPDGPGTYLKKYLSKIGITSTPTCSCNAKAAHMDKAGIEWCETNIDTIVGWLREEAEKRKLPFFDWPAKMLVQKAINSAKRAKITYEKENK
jgi:hypothetical protein